MSRDTCPFGLHEKRAKPTDKHSRDTAHMKQWDQTDEGSDFTLELLGLWSTLDSSEASPPSDPVLKVRVELLVPSYIYR